MIDPAKLSHDHFAPLVGDTVTLRAADGEIVATLAAADLHARAPGAAPQLRAPFTLTFHGPRSPRLQQGVHELDHPGLGTLAIFLVPTHLGDDGAEYQAAFA